MKPEVPPEEEYSPLENTILFMVSKSKDVVLEITQRSNATYGFRYQAWVTGKMQVMMSGLTAGLKLMLAATSLPITLKQLRKKQRQMQKAKESPSLLAGTKRLTRRSCGTLRRVAACAPQLGRYEFTNDAD